MELISYFSVTFNLPVNHIEFTFKKIYPATFLTLKKSGLYIDIVRPRVVDITNHYFPTEKRIDAMKDLLEILKWE
jgi:hypothetical protein